MTTRRPKSSPVTRFFDLAERALITIEHALGTSDAEVERAFAKRIDLQIRGVCPQMSDSVEQISVEVRDMRQPVVTIRIEVREANVAQTVLSEFAIQWDELPDRCRSAIIREKRSRVVLYNKSAMGGAY